MRTSAHPATRPATRALGLRGRLPRATALPAWGLLLPSMVFLIAFTYWPVVQVIGSSLTVRGFRGTAHWGLDNYVRLFGDPHFTTAVLNNLIYAAGTILPSLILALLFALALRETTPYTAVLRTLVAVPMLIPLVAAASLFAFIFLPNAGLLDYYLARLGVAETNWLGDPSLALGSIIAITVWKNTGYYMLFFLAGLAGIPRNLLDAAGALLWVIPFAWMAVASIRLSGAGAADLASLLPAGPFGWANFADAWSSGHFLLWYLNTIIVCAGILIVQCVTVSLAGYAFARLRFPGQNLLFALFLLQLLLVPPILIVPNLTTLVALHLYDTLPGIMAPYFASAFGVFLMRQTFRTIPREYEEAALVDGASRLRIIIHVLLPLSKPGLAAFAIVSVTSHWNEFLWPLMATSSPANQVLTVGLASFTAGAEAGSEWGVIAAGTGLVAAPLLLAFVLFQRRFVDSFTFSGIK